MIVVEILLALGVVAILAMGIYGGYKIGKSRDRTSDPS